MHEDSTLGDSDIDYSIKLQAALNHNLEHSGFSGSNENSQDPGPFKSEASMSEVVRNTSQSEHVNGQHLEAATSSSDRDDISTGQRDSTQHSQRPPEVEPIILPPDSEDESRMWQHSSMPLC